MKFCNLADWACKIEDHYSMLAGKHQPMDIEWAKDGVTGELFILQARPETVQSQKTGTFIENYKLDSNHGAPLVTGVAVGEKIGHGNVHVILDPNKINHFKAGDILVTSMTDPAWEPIMKRASAIVTDRGGRTCHSAIISRELGLPCIVGSGNATEILKTDTDVTVSCAEGEQGNIYYGTIPFEIERHEITDTERPTNTDNDERRRSRSRIFRRATAERRRWSGAARIYHQQSHRHSPDGTRQLPESAKPSDN